MITIDDPRLSQLLNLLTLEEKVSLLTGRDFWTTWPIEKIGLRRMLLSDGPSGVRGEFWDERDPSLSLPSGTALAATWDRAMATRYGGAAAIEARRKNVDVVLGPTINLHRSPLGGRHFEAFSEDPVLTGELAAAYVTGVQANGVAATPKHYVANDYETDRFTADSVVSERALRELYLLAFERAVTDGHAWAVMSSYNSINGVTSTENDLLETPLNSEWGFDGVVVSDWTGVRSLQSARASQDLVMPGPDGPWGDALVQAVRAGEIQESLIDRKVLRILLLAARVGALEAFEAKAIDPATDQDGVAFSREAAAAGMVLVQNDGVLPVTQAPPRIAVIGHNASVARTMGGGSASVVPERIVSPLEGICEAFPGSQVTYSIGASVQQGIAGLPLEELRNPVTGNAGVRARFLSADGRELKVEDRRSTELQWMGAGIGPGPEVELLELSTVWTPRESAEVRFGFGAVGHARIHINGELFYEGVGDPAGRDLGAAIMAPEPRSQRLSVTGAEPLEILIQFRRPAELSHFPIMAFSFGLDAPDDDPSALLADAVADAGAADFVVLVVGTNAAVESEGFDRTDLSLPGNQDALAEAILEANPNTVVVVNSGSPVLLPWRSKAAAVLLAWFGGQEMGHALGDVLTGAVEPGGRLPTTWPAVEADVPVLHTTPVEGKVEYSEGIHIGYRAWLRAGATPAYPFGHGLGYTTWKIGTPSIIEENDAAQLLRVPVQNTGTQAGKQVIQVYASRPGSSIERPERWLVGFAAVTAAPGESVTALVWIPQRSFAHWDNGWQYEPGQFLLSVGTSVENLEHDLYVNSFSAPVLTTST